MSEARYEIVLSRCEESRSRATLFPICTFFVGSDQVSETCPHLQSTAIDIYTVDKKSTYLTYVFFKLELYEQSRVRNEGKL